MKWIINVHYDRLIPLTWEYYYHCFGSISDKHFQTRKQGLLTQIHVTVRETLWNIYVCSCSQDSSVSVVSATEWTTEESHLYSCHARVFSSSNCPGQLQGPTCFLFNGIVNSLNRAFSCPFTVIYTHEVHRQVNLYLYNVPVFQCSLHCISAHCYTTHAHRCFDVNAVDHFTCLPHSQRMMAQCCSHTSKYYILAQFF